MIPGSARPPYAVPPAEDTYTVPELVARLVAQREALRPLHAQMDAVQGPLRLVELEVEQERARCVLDSVTETNELRRKAQLKQFEATDPGLALALGAAARLQQALDQAHQRLRDAELDYATTRRALRGIEAQLHYLASHA